MIVLLNRRSTCSGWVASQGKKAQRPSWHSSAWAIALSMSSSPATITSAPSSRKRRVAATPRPPVPPTSRQRLPASRPGLSDLRDLLLIPPPEEVQCQECRRRPDEPEPVRPCHHLGQGDGV